MADILVIEDNPGDVRLIRELFADRTVANSVHAVTEGTEALDFLHRRAAFADAPRPDIVLLDLNLPGLDGAEFLAEFKAIPQFRNVPVLVLTGSESALEIGRAYDRQANAVLTKPVDPEEFGAVIDSIDEFWLRCVRLPSADEDDPE